MVAQKAVMPAPFRSVRCAHDKNNVRTAHATEKLNFYVLSHHDVALFAGQHNKAARQKTIALFPRSVRCAHDKKQRATGKAEFLRSLPPRRCPVRWATQ